MKKSIFFLLLAPLLAACAQATPTATLAPSETPLPTATKTFTPQPPTLTPTFTLTPSITSTASITPTSTISPTPTFAFPSAQVSVAQAHCRYGPNVAYLHAADLYEGDTGTVRSRWYLSNWLLVKFDKLDYFCWVAPSVVEVEGNLDSIIKLDTLDLTRIGRNQYGPPKNVVVSRDGEKITISWQQVQMTEDKDRGYFLDLFVCQDGHYLWWPISFPDQYTTHYTIKDEAGCPAPSGGYIYTVEKHGYSQPEKLNWIPAP